ncbi:MAG: metal-dependent phosphohydrolase [Verrucomicrobiota bacterium]
MLNLHKMMIDPYVDQLLVEFELMYGTSEIDYGEILRWVGHLALENLCNSDAPYHNVEHTMTVAQVGQAILKGKHLNEGGVKPYEWLHFMIALLCHDIGYLRGICRGDKGDLAVIDEAGTLKEIPHEYTCAALTPYHVDRGKVFVRERFTETEHIDPELVAAHIEYTRFPPSEDAMNDTASYGALVRCADLIGQLADPNYLRKIPALFYEFSELGLNEKFGYETPLQMRGKFAHFFWNSISPYIQDGLRYLRVTQEGREWSASLYAQVFTVEHTEDKGTSSIFPMLRPAKLPS